jgi:predicted metalloprotease with PDZ domain
LADGIFLAGDWTEVAFDEGGTHYRLVFSRKPDFKDRKVEDDVRKIVRQAAAVFGDVPFDRYLFLFLTESDGGRGGIEHLYGTSICLPLDSFEEREAYRKFLGVTAHEFVHAWNVKRMRPAGLGPFDYTKESPTHNLYVAEGFTTYYGWLAATRGGALTREEYYKNLAEGLVTDRENAGIRVKSLEDQSWDWWLDSSIPYLTFRTNYTRGSLVALVLDLDMRDAGPGGRSLDDAMRALYRRTGKRATGYTDAELRQALRPGRRTGHGQAPDEMVKAPGALDVVTRRSPRLASRSSPTPRSPRAVRGLALHDDRRDPPTLDGIEPGSCRPRGPGRRRTSWSRSTTGAFPPRRSTGSCDASGREPPSPSASSATGL